MVVLKRLGDALRDGDQVLAVVRGSAVNQDGRSNGLMAPNPAAQMAVLRSAYANAGVSPRDVDFVEAHGTGTLLGDPIEARALGTVLGRGRGVEQPLLLGAVKSNLGHLEAAAGIAGFLKAVLAVQRGRIPANLGFDKPNPHIPFDDLRLKVVAEPMDWPGVDRPRRAGVSSFGFGGTNAHVVIEQAPAADGVLAPQAAPAVSTLVISGKSEARIASMAAVMAQWMVGAGSAVALTDIAHTLAHHRTRHATFATVCARDRDQAVAGLTALAAGRAAPGVVGPRTGGQPGGVVFVYSGQGSQWAGMGRALLADEPVFAAAVAELEPVFVAQTGFSLQQVLACGQPVAGIDRIQPVLVGMQLALTALWRSYGVTPDAVIGHSMGEVTAAVVAGALTPAEGLRVIATRSKLMSRLSGQGAMALLELDAAATQAVIADYPGVGLAVYASPRQTVIAGTPEHIDAVIAAVAARDRLARRIEVDVASHHPTIDPILPELRTALADLDPQQPTIPILTTTIETTQHTPTFDADYWAANLRNPVRFSQAITTATTTNNTYIEISPHPLLTHAITDTLQQHPDTPFQTLPTLTRDTDETITFHTNLNAFSGTSPSAARVGRPAAIPAMPWQHTSHWYPSSPKRKAQHGHPLLGTHIEMPSGRAHVWQTEIDGDDGDRFGRYPLHGRVVAPPTVFVEIALAAGSEGLGLPLHDVRVSDLEIERMFAPDAATRMTTQLAADQEAGGHRLEIHVRSTGGLWSRHAVARVTAADGTSGSGCASVDVETTVESDIVTADTSETFHRAVQTLVDAIPADAESPYLPRSFENIRIIGEVARSVRARAEVIASAGDGDDIVGRVTLVDGADDPTAEITGIRLMRTQPAAVPLPLVQKLFDARWIPTPIASAPDAPAGTWLVLSHDPETHRSARRFASGWQSETRRVVEVDLSDESAVQAAVADAAADRAFPPGGVVFFAGRLAYDGTNYEAALNHARDLVCTASNTARAIAGRWPSSSRMWVVTKAGLAVDADEQGDPAVSALRGLVRTWGYPGEATRVLADEPDVRASLIDVDAGDEGFAGLLAELNSPSDDGVVAWRGQHRFVERLCRVTTVARNVDPVRSDGSYIVTGGLGGLGMVVVRWLVDGGARRIVLNGRTAPSEEQRRELAGLGATEIEFVQGDIAEPGVATRVVAAAEHGDLSLRGLVHAAGVVDEQIVARVSRQGLERIWAPKVGGALRLHEATADRDLDWWVGFSSVSALLGAPGQGAYASANAYLDGLVAFRRAAGLPAMAINWGQWSDVGMGRSVTFNVLDPITPAEGAEALQSLVGCDLGRVGVARLRLDRAAAAAPEILTLDYFTEMAEGFTPAVGRHDESADEAADFAQLPAPDWSHLPAETARVEIEARLRAILAHELRTPAAHLDVDRTFPELGIDSMMAMGVLRATKKMLAVDLSPTMLWNHPTIASLAECLAETLKAPEHSQSAAPHAETASDTSDGLLDALFDSVEAAAAGNESGI